jgi:hypothetical protein
VASTWKSVDKRWNVRKELWKQWMSDSFLCTYHVPSPSMLGFRMWRYSSVAATVWMPLKANYQPRVRERETSQNATTQLVESLLWNTKQQAATVWQQLVDLLRLERSVLPISACGFYSTWWALVAMRKMYLRAAPQTRRACSALPPTKWRAIITTMSKPGHGVLT